MEHRVGSGYITGEEAENLLEALIESDAIELQMLSTGEEAEKLLVRLPYMMNDAVEYYLEFQNCRVRGEWEKEESAESFSFVEHENSKGLILRQMSGNTITIWYQSLLCSARCYQYHQIGHNWRKISGEENLRRLVNLLCVLHDKANYLGEEFCNEIELELAALAEFGPLRYFTPINESISDWYPETKQGALAMLQLTRKSGDEIYAALVAKYLEETSTGKKREKKIKQLAMELVQNSHVGIYQFLLEEVENASVSWEVRDYGQKGNEAIQEQRKRVEQKYRALGYEGAYPEMKQRLDGQEKFVQFVEEHPFTVLEQENYPFRIFSMSFEMQHPFLVEMKEEL